MNFYEYLDKSDLAGILYRQEYHVPEFIGRSKLVDWFDDICYNKRKVFVYGDYDVDGLMGLCIWKDTLTDFGVDFKCYKYANRTHNIDFGAVHQCINGNYDYMIITDTGSTKADIDSVHLITSAGTKVIIVDHHNTTLGYSDFGDKVLVINSTMDSYANLTVSGGALAFVCVSALYEHYHKKVPSALAAYALTSLYADCVDMSNDVNRSIYYMATTAKLSELPHTLRHFMSDYDMLNRRYITFNYSPRINSLFRAELFDILNPYLVEPNETILMPSLINYIETVYTENREKVGIMTDIVARQELDNFIIANLSSVKHHINDVDTLPNYTGLVANQLSETYGKPCVVYCDKGDGHIKGSFRDVMNRSFLGTFKTFCDANGHGPAFGINLSYKEFNNFYKQIEQLDSLMSANRTNFYASIREPVPILHSSPVPDINTLQDMAQYNEFAGDNIPLVVVQRVWMGGPRRKTSYYHLYSWGDMWIKSTTPLVVGTVTKILPIKRKKLELRVLETSSHF